MESTTAGTSQRSAHSRREIRGSISSSSRQRHIANGCTQDASPLSACCYFCLPNRAWLSRCQTQLSRQPQTTCPPPVCMPNSCPLQFCLLSASWWPGGGYTVAWKGGSTIKKTNSQNTGAGTTHARTHTRRREGAGAALPRVRPSQSCLACWRGWAYAVCGMCMCLQGGRRETQCTGNRGERTQPGLTTPSPAAPRQEPRQPLPPSVSAVPRSVPLPVYCSVPLSS